MLVFKFLSMQKNWSVKAFKNPFENFEIFDDIAECCIVGNK